MRIAWLVVVAACGGSPKSAAPMPAAAPAAEPAPTTVATNDPAPPPPGIAPDPCEGGEVTPASTGGGGEGSIGSGTVHGMRGHGSGVGQGGGNPCGGTSAHAPPLRLQMPTVTGPLDKSLVRRSVQRHIQKLQYCYERELLAHPGIAGTVTATFEIGTGGAVTSSTATGLASVDTCVADMIKTIEFPPPATPTKVVYPFAFRPKS